MIDAIVRRAVESSRGQISHRQNTSPGYPISRSGFEIESKTRTHLDWIRVNGGIFGAFFGLVFALSRIAINHGHQILAHLHIGSIASGSAFSFAWYPNSRIVPAGSRRADRFSHSSYPSPARPVLPGHSLTRPRGAELHEGRSG